MSRDRPFSPGDLPAPRDLPERDPPGPLGPSEPLAPLGPLEPFVDHPVASPEAWHERRRLLHQLFEEYVYGYAPTVPEVDVDVDQESVTLPRDDVRAVFVEAELDLGPPAAPSPRLAVVFPRERDLPVPGVLALNRLGNHTTARIDSLDPTPAVERFPGAGRDDPAGWAGRAQYWQVPYLLDRGYAFATVYCGAFDPDYDEFFDGVHPHFDAPAPDDVRWGTLAAWAWGLRCALSGLESVAGIDEERVALFGHSRRGKAALLAGAFDDRPAMVVPHQSGTGGLALARENDQETVGAITETFPHWFGGRYRAFAGRVDRLPVDQHLLASLVAPRPLLDTEGLRDHWANPGRARDALRAAAPVYDLLEAPAVPPATSDYADLLVGADRFAPETVGRVCQYRRDTGHTMELGYWRAILDFADLHLRADDEA
jgi:hypothetical protein